MASFPVFLFLFTLYIRPQDWIPGMIGFPTAFIIIPLGLLIGAVNRIRQPLHFRAPQAWLLMVYLAVIYISTLINVGGAPAFEQFDLFLRRVLVFYLVVWLLTSITRIQAAIWFILLLSGFLAFQAILQAQTGQSWGGMTPEPGYEEIRVRWYGDWDGPNVYSILFVMALGIAIELIFGPHRLFIRLMAGALSASYLTAIFYTNSRGAVLAVACMLVFYFKDRFKSVKALLFGVTAVAALFAIGPSRMSEVSSGESSAHERTWLWEQGLTLLKNNPVWGIGRGQFAKNVDLNLIAHNNYVQNFTETGLLGFFCFMSLLWFCFKGNYLLTSAKYEVEPKIAAIARMMNATLVGYCAVTFFVVMELDILYFFFGLWTAVYLNAKRRQPNLPHLGFTRNDTATICGTMIVILCMIWLAAVKQIV
jgi:putative inorganic carbon (hco3(-)) transporter